MIYLPPPPPPPSTDLGPLLPGARQIRVAVPGASEKPQLLPLQPPGEAGLPATFTFHVNAALSSRLNVELGETLTVLQVGDRAQEEVDDRVRPAWRRPLSTLDGFSSAEWPEC